MRIVAHKIRLKPNKEQESFLAQCCGVARFTYNWGLNAWNEAYKSQQKTGWMTLDKQLNSIKKEQFPWMYDVPSCVGQQSLSHLGRAFTGFFKKKTKHPDFHKKGVHDSFTLTNQTHGVKGNKLQITNNIAVKMYERLRYEGKILSYTVSRRADQWFVSIAVEVEDSVPLEVNENQVGLDIGIKSFLTTSDGQIIANPHFLKSQLKAIKHLNRRLSKKAKGSRNRAKARLKLAKKHLQVANQRREFLHRASTALIRQYQVIKVEDLNVAGMLKNHRLALAISELGWGEFKCQLLYKAAWYGRNVVLVNRWFPSSKTCSGCGTVKEDLTLKDRVFRCDHCGLNLDRDLNAAINIRDCTDIASGSHKPAEMSVSESMKQEGPLKWAS